MSLDVSTKYVPVAIDRLMPRSMQNSSNSAIAAKVVEDIQFLQERISRLKKQQAPNTTILETYQTMLKSREAVLEWLKENDELWCDESSTKNIRN